MSDIESIEEGVSVLYDASDLRALYGTCKRCRRNLIWIAAIPMLFLIFEFADGVRGYKLIFDAIPYAFAGVGIVFGLYFVSPLIQVRARRKNGWDVPMAVQLNGQGIATRHPIQDSQFHWAAIRDVVSKNGRLFLFTSPGCAIILPRRFFSSDKQFSSWVDRATSFWNEAKEAAAR